jgi:hypothetical protein
MNSLCFNCELSVLKLNNFFLQVSQESAKKSDGSPLASMEDMKATLQVKNIASQPLQQSKSDNSLHAIQGKAERK